MSSKRLKLFKIFVFAAVTLVFSVVSHGSTIKHVIHISIDGLRADAVTTLGPELATNFYRLRTEGAFTDNARTDNLFANTLTNHACQFTGRRVLGSGGHGWVTNLDSDLTIHQRKGEYVASVFDVAHDAGMSTGLYTSKSKFEVFNRSWNELNGAPDNTDEDDGKDKIDVYLLDQNDADLTGKFMTIMADAQHEYAFLHLSNPDKTGHLHEWDLSSSSEYLDAVLEVNHLLGRILDFVEQTDGLAGETALILTSDHGGILDQKTHGIFPSETSSGIVPFYAWGPGIAAGQDLYTLNSNTTQNPSSGNPSYSPDLQPIRNGDAANLALRLLGLGLVPGSSINSVQKLAVTTSQSFAITAWLWLVLN